VLCSLPDPEAAKEPENTKCKERQQRKRQPQRHCTCVQSRMRQEEGAAYTSLAGPKGQVPSRCAQIPVHQPGAAARERPHLPVRPLERDETSSQKCWTDACQ